MHISIVRRKNKIPKKCKRPFSFLASCQSRVPWGGLWSLIVLQALFVSESLLYLFLHVLGLVLRIEHIVFFPLQSFFFGL